MRWGDAVNWSVPLRDRATVETFRAAVDAACATVDRDPAELALTGIVRLAPGSDDRPRRHADDTISGPPEAIAERLDELHAAGIRHLTCFIGDEEDERLYPVLTRPGLDRLAAVLERVTSLAPPPAPTVTPQPT